MFSLSMTGQLRREENCGQVGNYAKDGERITMTNCNDMVTQEWSHVKVC